MLSVGQRLPGWVVTGCDEYARRLPRHLGFELIEIPPGDRGGRVHRSGSRGRGRQRAARSGGSGNVAGSTAIATESDRILSRVSRTDRVIALDERGQALNTMEIARHMDRWQQTGTEVAALIGGADGLHADCLARADETWSLSALTLPHALARLLLLEQLYRAWTLNAGHPYHRA
ncbi:MAG: 23S rRNA (pseudouridine(1915)-N(3))-methyltransferase RlmH [Pseudomonadota bacterium]